MTKDELQHYANYALGYSAISDRDEDIREALAHSGLKPGDVEKVMDYVALDNAEIKNTRYDRRKAP